MAPKKEELSNPQRDQAQELLYHGTKNLLIMGRAGTGKSTLLNDFRTHTKKKFAVVAPTGVAALNVGGETIHHFFRLWPGAGAGWVRSHLRKANPDKTEIYRQLEVLIIDEISMVRADLFDLMDLFLRLARKNSLPFGGVRLIMFGDLYQLPPVVTDQEQAMLTSYASPYFFDALAWDGIEGNLLESNLDYVELKTIYRQKDKHFVEFLQQVRHNQLDPSLLAEINSSTVDEALDLSDSQFQTAVMLTATNWQAEKINNWQLQQIDAQAYRFTARQKGQFDAKIAPAPEEIIVKRGARVMLTINDPDRRWINGSTGWLRDIIHDPETGAIGVSVELDASEMGGEHLVDIYPHVWEVNHSVYDHNQETIVTENLGKYRQLPLRLAWAITIHKSQGQTYDQVIIDLGRAAFASGQTYVALSRCTHLAGLHLARPLRNEDILLDQEIVTFIHRLENLQK